MKLTAILLTVAFFQLHAAVHAQSVTISGKELSLKEIFDSIRKQTGYILFSNSEILSNTRNVSLSVRDMPLPELLEVILKDQPVDYVIQGKTIALSKRRTSIPETVMMIHSDPPANGRVIGPDGQPIPGVTLMIKGKSKGTTTKPGGEFAFQVADGDMVEVTSIGFEPLLLRYTAGQFQQVRAGKANDRSDEGTRSLLVSGDPGAMIIRLAYSTSPLDEVQIVAYGTNTQRFNVGNVTVVTAQDIAKNPVTDPLLALQGRVPGMTINQVSGVPGSAVEVNIRGLNSLTAGAQPLFIVDGVPYAQNVLESIGYGAQRGASALNFIPPSDIESITVLKDADATAIYGSRGANGVVLITTKKAKAGKTSIDINYYHGIQNIALDRIKLLNTKQYVQMRKEAFYWDSVFNPGADIRPNMENAYDLLYWDTTRETDWKKFWVGNTAATSNASISLSGGTEQIQYLIAGSYNRQTTVFPGNYYTQAGSIRFALNGMSADRRLRTSLSGAYTVNDQRMPNRDYTEWAMYTPPNAPSLLNEDGSLNFAPNPQTGRSTHMYGQNPLGEVGGMDNPSKSNNLIANLDISYALAPGLSIKTALGYNKLNSNPTIYGYTKFRDPAMGPALGYAFYGTAANESWILEPQLNYDRAIGGGRFSFLAGATVQSNKNFGQGLSVQGIASDALVTNPSAGTSYFVYGSSVNYRYAAIFGKVNYMYREKYVVDLLGRRDGSSRFGDARKFANFWAAGAGWIFSEEPWVANNQRFLSYGKLRASYGITGNDQIGDYQYLDRYQMIGKWSGISMYQGVVGMSQVSLFNPNYEWERTDKFELGLEMGFFKDRLLINVSHYINHSGNQLGDIVLPSMVGASSVPGNILAKIRNKGTEIVITTENVKKQDFNWRTSFNISFQENRLLEYSGTDSRFKKMTGRSLSVVLVPHYMGVDPATGRYLFADMEGKPVYADQNPDMEAKALDLAAEYFGGLDNSISYKRLNLSFFFQYSRQIAINTLRSSFAGSQRAPGTIFNQWVSVMDDRWHAPGDVAEKPRYSQQDNWAIGNDLFPSSDASYVNASYIRCKNVSLSWSLPESWAGKALLKNARVYVQAQNLFTITTYPGSDPETHSFFNLPPMKVWTAGIQMTL